MADAFPLSDQKRNLKPQNRPLLWNYLITHSFAVFIIKPSILWIESVYYDKIIPIVNKDYPLDGYKTIALGILSVDKRVLWSDEFLCTDPM